MPDFIRTPRLEDVVTLVILVAGGPELGLAVVLLDEAVLHLTVCGQRDALIGRVVEPGIILFVFAQDRQSLVDLARSLFRWFLGGPDVDVAHRVDPGLYEEFRLRRRIPSITQRNRVLFVDSVP